MASLARVQELLCVESADSGSRIENEHGVAYIWLIQQAMEANHIGLRKLALAAGVNRARLGRILHRDPAKRYAMTIVEFQALLRALEIDPIEAIVVVELIQDVELVKDERFTKLAVMLSTLLRGLPQRLAAALQDLDGMDGSEIRTEWGTYFQSAVVNRMVHEVGQILERRTRLSSNSDPFSL